MGLKPKYHDEPLMVEARNYWAGELQDHTFQMALGKGGSRPVTAGELCELAISLDGGTRDLLKRKVQSELAVFSLVLSAVQAVLYGYAEEDRVVTAIPAIDRPETETNSNLLYIGSTIKDSSEFRQVVLHVKEKLELALQYQYYPAAALLGEQEQHMLSAVTLCSPSLHRHFEPAGHIRENPSSLVIEWRWEEHTAALHLFYIEDYYDRAILNRMLKSILSVLGVGLSDPSRQIGGIRIHPDEQAWLVKAGSPGNAGQEQRTIFELFEDAARVYRDHTAVIFDNVSVTYGELYDEVQEIAGGLRQQGIGKGSLVAVPAERSLQSITAILGVMASGAAFLPLDAEIPSQRFLYIVEECKPDMLIAANLWYQKREDLVSAWTIGLESVSRWGLRLAAFNVKDEAPDRLEHLAYIIYTSGTTGKPKGVMITQEAFADRIIWRSEEYGLSETDCILQWFPLYFDGFLTSFFTPLITGAAIVQCGDAEARNPQAIVRLLQKHQVTHFICIPSMFIHLLEQAQGHLANSLRMVTLAGERMTQSILDQCSQLSFELVNEYGPTECTVVATCLRSVSSHTSIGKPVRNTDIYILGKDGKPVPAGVTGEICIGGIGVSPGYVNNEQLTQERFIPNPCHPATRLYCTGDLGCWTEAGEIEYWGRRDRQVKINGYRIELDEIERSLSGSSRVANAAVVVSGGPEGAGQRLIAYVEGDCKGKEQELQEFLKRLLPEYMIPERIIVLEQLPVTVQGKVDYKILESYPPEEKEHQADSPLTPLQQRLANLYSVVLKLPRVDPSISFFEHGGNSITASILLQQLQDQGFAVPAFREFYSNSTVFKLSALLESAGQTVLEPIPHLGFQEYYETSSTQKQMFLLENFMNVQTAYNMPGAVEITGTLDVGRLQHALQKVTDANEILRTSFHLIEGLPVQKVHSAVNPDFIFEEDPYSELDGSFRQFIRPFRLNQPSQLRLKLIRRDAELHWLFIDMHHMIGDAVTIERLLQQIVAAYGEESGEPACAPLQYKDYAAWSNEQLRIGRYDNQLEYWKSLFDDEVPVLEYPCADPLQPVFSNKGRRMIWHLEDRLFAQVSDYAAKSEVTLFMLLAAVYHLTLAKMTGHTDIVTGTPVSLRSKKALQDVMGVFVNTLPLRSRPAYHKTIQEYLEEIRELSLQMYENMDVPLEDITSHVLREASPGNGASRSLFQTVFAFQDYSLQPSALGALSLTPLSPDYAATKFDFMMEAFYTGSGLRLQLDYNPSRMDERYAEELAARYRMLLEYIVKHSGDGLIQDLPNLLEEEYRQYVITYNETSKDYPLGLSVHQLFERQVHLTPDRIALTHRGTHLTYKELNGQANQIAVFLRKQGIQPNELVGICADHGFELLIAILGVLKSGAAFLPIDPDQTQRAEYMLADSGARILLTDHAEHFAAFAEQLKIVKLSGAGYEQECTDNLPSLQRPDDLAYVIYTSGTSGQPKGTMIHHRGLTNYICWANEVYAGEEPVDFACYSSIAFDLTITSLFTPLIAGNRIWLYSGANKSLLIRDIIQDNQHCIVKLTPSHLKLIEEMDLSHTRIQKLIVGGEDLKNALAASIVRQSGGKIRIFNEYGPTETVVGCMIYEYVQGEEEGSVPIGVPAGNMQIYVLDAGLQPVPPRTAGEIYIAGVGVAKGYLHQEAMTQEKFIPNPFDPGKRMYKTGDLARRNASGELVYLGRADDQIKIRGHRIEPGEIEQVLMQLPEVGQVVIVDGKHSNGERFLAAYYTSAQTELAAELHTLAKRNLPEYMVPRFFSRMERLPVTANGKLDRSLLRNLPLQQEEARAQPVFATETESMVASIWKEVLHTGSVGPQDNFFDAGGSSILAMKLFDRLDKQLPGEIEMTDIFAYPTIRLQAELLDKKAHAKMDKPVLAPSFELPEAYYTGRLLGWMEKTWIMKLSSKDWMEFHACCTRYGVTAGKLLAGVYIYSLAEISGKTRIPLVVSIGRQLQLIELSMAGISDFPQLLGALNKELELHKNQPGLQDTLFSESAIGHIYPLIEMESGGLPAASLKERYDLRLSYRQHPDSMTIELQYNAMKLSNRTADLFQGFAHYLGAVIHLK